MKAIIFAGGVGTRLWPLSRKQSPKQFESVIGEKSTLQVTVEKLLSDFNWRDIYIATNEEYKSLVLKQLPKIIEKNIITEPERKDVGPAVGLATAILYKHFPNTPTIILWSDHIIKKQQLFTETLKICAKVISDNKYKIIFVSQKPRFASQNLGWIKHGKVIFNKKNIKFYSFENFIYRPSLETANQFFRDGNYSWNVGYFVTTPHFLWQSFQKYQPEIFAGMREIYNSLTSKKFDYVKRKVYSSFPKLSFDNAILEKIEKNCALVVTQDFQWSDIGAWEALKEALQTSPEQNVIKGKVLITDTRDSLVYNFTNQLLVTIDIDGLLVINTPDVVLVCHKNSVPKIKKLVEGLENTENGHLV